MIIMVGTLPGTQPARPGSAGTPLPGISASLRDPDTGPLLPILTTSRDRDEASETP
jgi:acyl-coenzyme A synthetase/AMP-(fatty) acid ligase